MRELEIEREMVDPGADVLELTGREPEISFQIVWQPFAIAT